MRPRDTCWIQTWFSTRKPDGLFHETSLNSVKSTGRKKNLQNCRFFLRRHLARVKNPPSDDHHHDQEESRGKTHSGESRQQGFCHQKRTCFKNVATRAGNPATAFCPDRGLFRAHAGDLRGKSPAPREILTPGRGIDTAHSGTRRIGRRQRGAQGVASETERRV